MSRQGLATIIREWLLLPYLPCKSSTSGLGVTQHGQNSHGKTAEKTQISTRLEPTETK
jgi:hypothetical protein